MNICIDKMGEERMAIYGGNALLMSCCKYKKSVKCSELGELDTVKIISICTHQGKKCWMPNGISDPKELENG